MASESENSVVVELEARIDDFMRGIQTAVESFKDSMSKMVDNAKSGSDDVKKTLDSTAESAKESGEKTGRNFGEGLSLIAAAVGTEFLLTIKENVEKAAEYAENLGTLQIETGDSAQNLQKLQYAFAAVGVSSQQAGMEFSAFQRRIEQAAEGGKGNDIFSRVGLDPKKMATNTITQNIDLVADKFKELSTAQERNKLLTDSFGRTGYQLGPIFENGAKSIEDFKKQAQDMGAVIDDDTKEKLEGLQAKITELSLTTRTFYAEFAAPVIDAITAIITGVQKLVAQFEKLSNDQKLGVLIASLTASFLVFEKAIEFLRRGFLAFVPGEVFDALLALQGFLLPIIIAVGAFAAAFATNFAGLRDVVGPILSAIQGWFVKFGTVLGVVWRDAVKTIGPAISQLGAALQPLLGLFAHGLIEALSNTPWGLFEEGAHLVISAIATLIGAITQVVKFFEDNRVIIGEVAMTFVTLLFPALVFAATHFKEIVSALQQLYQFLATNADRIRAIASVVLSELSPALSFLVTHFRDVANILIDLIFPTLRDSITHFDQVKFSVQGFILVLGDPIEAAAAVFNNAMASMMTALANLLRAFADFVSTGPQSLIPGLKNMGDVAYDVAGKLDALAAAHEKAARAALANVIAHEKSSKLRFDLYVPPAATKPPPPPAKTPPGDEHIRPIQKAAKNTAGEAAREDIEKIKAALLPLQDALAVTELAGKKLSESLRAIGDIDTPEKFAQAQLIAADQLDNLNEREREQQALLRGEQGAIASLEAARKRVHDPKIVREYTAAIREETAAERATQGALYTTSADIAVAKLKTEKDYIAEVQREAELGEDTSNSFKERVTAAQLTVDHLREAGASIKDQLAAMQKLVGLQKEFTDYKEKVQDSIYDQQNAQIENAKKLRDASPADNASDERQRKIDDAFNDMAASIVAANKAQAAVTDAEANLAAVKANESLTSTDVTNAQLALTNAETAASRATTDFTVAQMKATQAVNAATPAQDDVDKGLLDLANKTIPDVMQAMKLMKDGVNPVVSVFLTLFQQSSAFQLVQQTLQKIMARLAQVFDALRPVLELLLGALVGVVNIFLTFYNVIVTILDLFGLHIQKIKLVNDQLDTLAGVTKPLIDIVHDLPTIDQYNKGQTGDLQAQQDQSDTDQTTSALDTGFDNTVSKLGEIFGTLVAIKLIIGLLQGQSLASQTGGIFSGIGSFFGKLFGSSSSGNSGGGIDIGNAGSGSYGDPDAPTSDDIESLPTSDDVNDLTDAINDHGIIAEATAATPKSSASSGLSSVISALSAIAPAIGSYIGGKVGGQGGQVLGSVIGGLPSIIGDLGKKATGASNTLGLIGSGLSIFQGLSQGGTFSQTLSGIGGAIGTIGGPLGTAIGSTLGGIIGSFFGPHVNAYNNPDIDDTSQYGTGVANLLGHQAGANGQTFQQDSNMASLFGGKGGIAEVEETLAQYGTAANAPAWLQPMFDSLESMFGESATGSGQLNFGKNIGNQNITGAEGVSGQIYRYNDLDNALNNFATGLATATQTTADAAQSAAQNLGDLLAGASNVDLASVFGNGQVSAVNGGYMVSGGNVGMNTSAPQSTIVAPQITVTVASVIGADKTALQTQLGQVMGDVMSKWSSDELAARRTLQFVNGTGIN